MNLISIIQNILKSDSIHQFGVIASILILFGSGLTILTGLEQLTGRKDRSKPHILLFLVSIVVFNVLYNIVFIYSGIHEKYHFSCFLFFTSIYAVGPLNYLYYRSLVDPEVKLLKGQGKHLVAPGLMLLCEIVFQFFDVHTKEQVITSFISPNHTGAAEIIMLAGGIVFVLYQLYFVWICIQLWNEEGIKVGVRTVFVVEIYNSLSPLPIGIWLFLGIREMVLVTGLMVTTVMILMFLINNRFPDLFKTFERELIRKKYERSFLKGIDTDLLYARLEYLMNEEKVYQDYEINLQSLADRLSLTTHQLSQFLNERIGVSFNAFINEYRIDEAKQLLRENHDMTVLQICFHVGSSSKSTFNAVFKNSTGMTPSEYRSNKIVE